MVLWNVLPRDINAHFMAARPFSGAAECAGVNADFKRAGLENFEVAINPVGCVKPVFDNAAFANADFAFPIRACASSPCWRSW